MSDSGHTQKRPLFEQASDPILIVDQDGTISEANWRATRLLGYEPAEIVGMHLRELIPQEDLDRQPLQLPALQAGKTLLVERPFRCKDGDVLYVEISATALDDGRFQGIFRDITGRRRATEDMRRMLSILSATLESTADGILVVDLDGNVATFNQRFVEMWGLPEELLATRDDDRMIEYVLSQLADPQGFVEKIQELYAAPDAESYDLLEFKDGRAFERYSRPQRIEGKSVGRVWSFRDITERLRTEGALRRSEEQLRHAQKMEAIGRLAGGVAHDFNNLLTAILGYGELLMEELPQGMPARRRAEEIRASAERAAGLTRQLLAFSRKQVVEPVILDLKAVLDDTNGMLRRLIGEDIELVTHLAPDLGQVKADPGQLQQVLFNLAVNARDAMPQGGTLSIEALNVSLDEAAALSHPDLRAGEHVLLSVHDTGHGMDGETRARAFEPFFTTKATGKGTGLGLATVYGIVQQSRGAIELESAPGRGTTFRIWLPRQHGEPDVRRDVAPRDATPATGESVLLVEDESFVRALVRETLTRDGFGVIEAANGKEALDLASRYRGKIALLLTDIVMPGMSGRELADRLRATDGSLPVIFMSGYNDESNGPVDRRDLLLPKPFRPQDLLQAVHEKLYAAGPDETRSA